MKSSAADVHIIVQENIIVVNTTLHVDEGQEYSCKQQERETKIYIEVVGSIHSRLSTNTVLREI